MTGIRRYWDLLRRWLWLVVLGAVVAGGVSYFVSRTLTPIYRATATLIINQAQSNSGVASMNDILTSERLARTYGELMKKRPVIEQVIGDLQLQASYEQVATLVDVRPLRDTQLVTLAVEGPDPQLAADMANSIANTFIGQVMREQLGQTTQTREILQRQTADLERQIKSTSEAIEQVRRTAGDQPSTRLGLLQSDMVQYQSTYAQLLRSQQEMALAEARAANAVRLVDPAVRPDRPVRPQVLLNTAIAALVGLMLAIGVALAIEYLDDAVKTPEMVEQSTGLHTLGAVALAGAIGRRGRGDKSGDGERLLVESSGNSQISEAFRILRTNLDFAQLDRSCRTMVVTSPNPGEGKSTVAVNLAAIIAQGGKRVLIVDGDLRRPTLHRTFSLENREGLTTSLARDAHPLDGAITASPFPNLSVMTSGPLPPNPAEMLGQRRMTDLLKRLTDPSTARERAHRSRCRGQEVRRPKPRAGGGLGWPPSRRRGWSRGHDR